MKRLLPACCLIGAALAVTIWMNPFGAPTMQAPVFIKADPAPIKTRPADPGGMIIPFQDLLVWELIR